ncbi:MarR family winged helix-turn-helix transcriptional regulator [Clostridium estertheticum]|uniref:MarR family winged helix-turn-helix transcriptional regulator n=1 Tax=Clostridium estertheticum TaxID=238834 RepID=UPI001C6E1169|nr:MarR family transcriptional regulator [Clostridium estertheticum]MBW9153032.1 MarR family transcriptional regulator [Clostridium estertheticum]WLC82606.1 MarR family transcriptional regulator [Clostridium estertheticum]
MNDKYIIHFISRTRKKMISFIEKKLLENGLNGLIPSHGNILTALYENNGKLTMKKIAEITRKDKSTITPLINKLLEHGYITKEKDETDKRVTYIIITSRGNQIKDKYNAISNEVNITAYKDFSQEEKEIFLKLLKKMNNNFNSIT